MQKLVKKAYTNPPLAMKSFHNETNNKGIKMIQFVISNGLKFQITNDNEYSPYCSNTTTI